MNRSSRRRQIGSTHFRVVSRSTPVPAGISFLEDYVDENQKNDVEMPKKDLEKPKKDPEKRKQDPEDVRKTESRRGRRPIDLDTRRKRNELLSEMHKLLLIETEEELIRAMRDAGLRNGSPQFEEVLRIWREYPI